MLCRGGQPKADATKHPLWAKHVTFLEVRALLLCPPNGGLRGPSTPWSALSHVGTRDAFSATRAQGFTQQRHIWEQVKGFADKAKSVLVLLDSMHTEQHVMVRVFVDTAPWPAATSQAHSAVAHSPQWC